MVSTVIPEILYSQRFWLIVGFGLCVAVYFAMRKSPTSNPRIGKFIVKHKRDIKKIIDIFLIYMVLLWSYFPLSFVWEIFRDLSESESIRTMSLQSDWMFLFSSLIIWSGTSGFFVGCLSVFQSNITKIKRIILLIVCLLPIVFTVLHVLTGITESPWSTVQLCIYCSASSWIVNMPAVLFGKDFFELSGNILQKVKLVFGHYAR